MFRSALIATLALLFYLPQLAGQQRFAAAALAEVPLVELPAQDNDRLLAAELAVRRPDRPQTFALTLPVNVQPDRDGKWTNPTSDSLLWRWRVRSPGAKSLNLGFTRFALPQGARLYLTTRTDRFGPFTAADNAEHAQFWSPLLRGDELMVELLVPAGEAGNVDLIISSVNHDFEGVMDLISDDCHLDVACGAADGYPQVDAYRDVIRSVAAYTVEGRERCTGFLINNTNQDGRPLFLTANHCGVNPATAPTLVTYWNFENDECRLPGSGDSGSTGDGRLEVFNTGARHLASYSATDVTLLELDEPVNPRARAYFAGWSAINRPPTGRVAIVHHPNLDEKRISFTEQPLTRSNILGEADADGSFYRVPYWEVGSTESGSSGAPLFDTAGRVRGQLFGGRASCGNQAEDIFGSFARSFIGGGTPASGLQAWLDPCGTGTTTLDGLDAATLSTALVASPACRSSCTGSTTEYTLFLGEAFPVGTRLSATAHSDLTITLPATTSGGNSITLLADPAAAAAGTYPITVVADGGSGLTDTVVLTLTLVDSAPAAVDLLRPEQQSSGVDPFLELGWRPVGGVSSYDLQISLDPEFGGLTADLRDLVVPNFVPEFPLAGGTQYYWRVRGRNDCGTGAWSSPRIFTTADRSCLLRGATALPVPIPAAQPGEVVASLEVSEDLDLKHMEVIVGLEHTFVGDLSLRLVSPAGKVVALLDPPLGGACPATNLYVIFADGAGTTAADFSEACEDGDEGSYRRVRPVDAFSQLAGASSRGTWKLVVNDEAAEDGGAITDFRLRVCEDRVDARDLSVALLSPPIRSCSNFGSTALLQLGADFDEEVSLRVEADGLELDNYTFNFDPATGTLEVRFSAWTIVGPGTADLSFVVIAADGTERRAVNTLQVLPVPEPVTPLPARLDEETVTFRWRPSATAESYGLQVSTDAEFGDTVYVATTAGRQLTVGRAALPAQFFWRVVSVNPCGSFPGPARDIALDTTSSTHHFSADRRISVYPNPAVDHLTVELEGNWTDGGVTAALYTAAGTSVRDWNNLQPPLNRLELGALPAGVYFLRLNGRFGGLTERILLLR
ncbi:proprotein convertase P-domain-containing protein [Neolewinella litorea]|uniref:T9SS type A sorting domain-containing protein n=1 Tax=Neolewinella litorea TaxID=2562452 RepID=A0A4V3XKQ7_9BACT|nr:proprotein convertase P-domain-containing protein [Neolewinella litorea]THH37913.1 T9SS type A sorting domain-containing protein [Neolewinella litorea]